MATLRGVLTVVAKLRQLLIEGLDGGFLLAKDFLYQLVAMGFERLLLCEEFIDRIVGHIDYDPIAGLPAGAGAAARGAKLAALFPFFAGRYYRNNNLRRYDQSLFGCAFVPLFRRRFLNRECPVRVVNNHGRLLGGSSVTYNSLFCLRIVSTHHRSRSGAGCQKGKNRRQQIGWALHFSIRSLPT